MRTSRISKRQISLAIDHKIPYMIMAVERPYILAGGGEANMSGQANGNTIESISKNVKAIRRQRGMTSEQAAKACGFDRSTYSRIETGKKILKVTELNEVARGLKCDVRDLFGPFTENLSPEVQVLVKRLQVLPEEGRIRILKLLEAGADAPEDLTEAALTLLERRQSAG
jgi:transcriptional regulator with XRE-family HTH domain